MCVIYQLRAHIIHSAAFDCGGSGGGGEGEETARDRQSKSLSFVRLRQSLAENSRLSLRDSKG